eukprot:SAG31_NODE_650_length_13187_cov_3.011843_6_plen_196_part_00
MLLSRFCATIREIRDFNREKYGTDRESVGLQVIFGGTATGVMAAIGAANASTTQPPLRIALLVVGTTPLGGMTSGGLADVDTGDRGICGGFSREFFFRVNQVYTGVRSFPRKGQECRVSLRIFEQMLAEVADEVTVVRGVAGLSVRHMAMDTRKIATLTVRDRSGKDLELAGKVRRYFLVFVPTIREMRDFYREM